MAIDPSLLPRIVVGKVCSNPSSLNRLLSHRALHATSDKAIYLASMDNSAVIDCFSECQVIAPLAIMKMYPVVNFCSSEFMNAVSVYPRKGLGCSTTSPYGIPYDLVPDRYLNTCFSALMCCMVGFAV